MSRGGFWGVYSVILVPVNGKVQLGPAQVSSCLQLGV